MAAALPASTSDHLFGRLREVAARAPDKVAVSDGDAALTFAEFANRAASFCAELADAGVQPRDHVAVVMPNVADFLVAAFAIWKHNAILTPMHAQLRERELIRYVADCDARAIVTTEAMGEVASTIMQDTRGTLAHAWLRSKGGTRWLYRRGPSERPATGPALHGDPISDPEWPALTQYSTGSTGHPKRITRSHAHLIGEVTAVSEVLARTETDRVLGVAPFFHAHGLTNAALGAILTGACLYPVETFFPRDVARLIEREGITGFPGSPFIFQMLAELRETATFSNLRWVVSAGAPLPDAVASAFRARYGVSVRELYGCTEAGVVTIERGDRDARRHSVGLPIPGVVVRIVDAEGQPVAAGEKGLVQITSPYAATSYDQSEEQTEAHFVGRSFYPGDLGLLTPNDGQLVLLGRDRGFINVAGNKADPVEVESVLLEMPAIAEAAVLGVPDGASAEKIKAVLVVSSPCTREEILTHCARRLAPFKVPRVIEFRKELPKNLLGKLLRKYLLDEEEGRA